MEWSIAGCDASIVRARIATAWLANEVQDSSPSQRLGEIDLRPHQHSAVERISQAIAGLGGALLCDEVGLGKTYVALAVARSSSRILVIAPAVLRSMWSAASRRAHVPVRFISFESISRRSYADCDCDFLIVDEAHHVRNPRTRRYVELSAIAHNKPVLLLSATPIHNKRADLAALLALFLGSRAESLDALTLSRCIVRRTVNAAGELASIPVVRETVWVEAKTDDHIVDSLLALPPPVSLRDAGAAPALAVFSLIRQWASSDDALLAGVRRRIRRAVALAAALEDGTYPSAMELESWVRGDDDEVQLGFASLLAPASRDAAELLSAIRKHEEALRSFLKNSSASLIRTRITADIVRAIGAAHPSERIVVFSQYADTILGLFREMRGDPYVCALTGRGASIASGRIKRSDALELFAPQATGARTPKAIERIELLLATDLLSEGVNLQDASVVVHLDLPWTPARLQQRIGRVARMGSLHDCVSSYAFTPPSAAENVLRLAATVRRKESVAARTVGRMHNLPVAPTAPLDGEQSIPEANEAIRTILVPWKGEVALRAAHACCVNAAGIASDIDGFVASTYTESGFELVASDGARLSSDPRHVLSVLRHASGPTVGLPTDRAGLALTQIEQMIQRRRTLEPTDAALGAKVRRAALRRLAQIESSLTGHRRLRSLSLMQQARKGITGPLDIAGERALNDLVHNNLCDDRWLNAVVSMPVRQSHDEPLTNQVFISAVDALLLLVRN